MVRDGGTEEVREPKVRRLTAVPSMLLVSRKIPDKNHRLLHMVSDKTAVK